METHHFRAVTRGLAHGHVSGIERRLSPWRIEVEVVEHRGVAEWHLSSDVESEREMSDHLRKAVIHEIGRDAVRPVRRERV